MRLPRRAGIAVAATAGSGIACGAAAALVWRDLGVGPVDDLIAMASILALHWAFPIMALRREETEAFQLDEAFFVVMALLLPPLGVVAAFAAAALVTQVARRRPIARIAFNTGQAVLSTALGLAVVRLIGTPGGGVGMHELAGAVLGAAMFLAVNGGLVSGIIALIEERPLAAVLTDGLPFRLLVWVASVAIGLLAAISATAYPWALLLAVLPMGVVQAVLAGWLHARRERKRVDALLRTALETHASVRTTDVEEMIAASARELLSARAARIDEHPPGEGEIGAPLQPQEPAGRWLIVTEPRGMEPLAARDVRLLEAVAAVGSGALANAELVERIKHQAFHDALTGLPNQVLFEERLSFALTQARRSGEGVGVMLLDLDQFKKVNDSLGHHAGNELLKLVSERLTTVVRTCDTVARMAGDEFTILITGIRAVADAASVAEKILEVFRRPFVIDGVQMFITPSIGIATYPMDGTRSHTLLRNADSAMYEAKKHGRNRFRTYVPAMNSSAYKLLTLESDLHDALDREELSIVYQPQFEMRSGRIGGVEALVRWKHPRLGMIGPNEFVPLAEETGMILNLDSYVLRRACDLSRRLRETGLPPIRVSVNLSGRDFEGPNVAGMVLGALGSTGVEPSSLELEVTETAALAEAGAMTVFNELRSHGVQIAIDDFGTGYSSLSRLRELPIDRLKIDRSFTQEITTETHDAPIVKAMIAMAHGLGLEVVAEGVETKAQHTFLRRHGCDLVQGYLLSRPIESEMLESLLRGWSTQPSGSLHAVR